MSRTASRNASFSAGVPAVTSQPSRYAVVPDQDAPVEDLGQAAWESSNLPNWTKFASDSVTS
ncbi:hypothetical protein STANM309S_06289 [Streptomyces tanashiensis]